LELGAEDYITKPFYASEVIARIKNAFRAATAEASPIIRAGMLEIDRRSRQVKIGEKQVALTATEYALLEFLMNNPGIVFARGQLLDAVWGNQRVVTERTVDVFMLRLRHKLGRLKEVKRVLNSVRGFGYRFDPEMVESSYAREKKVVYMHRVK
jgi:DNA-binding response OmpR family regulator